MNDRSDEELARARELGHEPRDAHMHLVEWAGLGLIVIVAAALGGMYLLTGWLTGPDVEGRIGRVSRKPPPMFSAPQANQSLIRERRQAARQRILESYSWVDREQGVARIPIRRAMQLIAADESLLKAAESVEDSDAKPDMKPDTRDGRSSDE